MPGSKPKRPPQAPPASGGRNASRAAPPHAHAWPQHLDSQVVGVIPCLHSHQPPSSDRAGQGRACPHRLLPLPTGSSLALPTPHWEDGNLGASVCHSADGTDRIRRPAPRSVRSDTGGRVAEGIIQTPCFHTTPTPAVSTAHGPHGSRWLWNPMLLGAGLPGAPGCQTHRMTSRSILFGTQFCFRRTSNLQPVGFPGLEEGTSNPVLCFTVSWGGSNA